MTQPKEEKAAVFSTMQRREALDLPVYELHRRKIDSVACVYVWLTDEAKQNDDKKIKEKKTHKERKNYNATSMNDISQVQQRSRMNLGGKDTGRDQGETRGIDTYTSWLGKGGKAFASMKAQS